MGKIVEFRKYLSGIEPGLISDTKEETIRKYLAEIWDDLEGGNDHSMASFKLDRIESLTFIPPTTIQFEIERHGQTSLGSVYADIQQWTIDLGNLVAECNPDFRKRAAGEKDKPLDAEQLAKEIAHQIINANMEDERLIWQSNRRVNIEIGKVIPKTNPKTTAGRRKRFAKLINPILNNAGWFLVKGTKAHAFEKATEPS